MIFRNAVPSTWRKHCISCTKTNELMLIRDIIAVDFWNLKIKLSHYRPGHAVRPAGGWGSQNF